MRLVDPIPKDAKTTLDSWLKYLAVRRTTVSERAYWIVFALLVLCAIGFRVFWTYVLQIPFVTPDTPGYVDPIKTHWLLPFSDYRTSGTSMFISSALTIFRHPAGILILNGVLAVGSAALLAVAIKRVLKQKLLSLVALFMVAFTAKNISLEYYLMSEHYARVLYIIYAALMLWYFQNPRRTWLVALISLSVVLNILVKPSALVLVVATIIAFLTLSSVLTTERRRIALGIAVFLVTVAVPLFSYMLMFQARFGTFGLSQFDGYNLYSHVGHLTLLNGGKYPALKERLNPLLIPYVANYAAKGDYQPNWLIYGTLTPELKRDFGDESPARTISDYVFERYGSRDRRWQNQVYGDLAVEAMWAHPVAYLLYSAERAGALWREGYHFYFFHALRPSVSTLEHHREDRTIQREWYYLMYGEAPPQCSAGPVVPKMASGPLAALFQGPIASCEALPYEDPSIRNIGERIDRTYRVVTNPIRNNFSLVTYSGAMAALIAGVILLLLGGRRILNMYGFGLLLVLVLLGYTMLHGLINVASPNRMTTNVQDYAIVAALVFIVSAAKSVKRLLLYAIAMQHRKNSESISN